MTDDSDSSVLQPPTEGHEGEIILLLQTSVTNSSANSPASIVQGRIIGGKETSPHQCIGGSVQFCEARPILQLRRTDNCLYSDGVWNSVYSSIVQGASSYGTNPESAIPRQVKHRSTTMVRRTRGKVKAGSPLRTIPVVANLLAKPETPGLRRCFGGIHL